MNEDRVGQLLGSPVVYRRPVGGGYTPAERWVVQLADGRSAFVKVGVTELTAEWLRQEYRMYSDLQAPFMAKLLGWADEDDAPMLILEDLSACAWPPPWTDGRVAAVLAMLAQVAAAPPPAWLPSASEERWIGEGWAEVAEDPAPLLSTGIVSADWLERSLPVLLAAGGASVLDGAALCHFDVRSDNLCFRANGSAVIVDWNFAELSNPRLDIAFWLPSLLLEGGPSPESVLPHAAPEAAVVAGFFASRCGLPVIPDAPAVREFQRRQLQVALPWACGELGIPEP
jgi:hypothetical protein